MFEFTLIGWVHTLLGLVAIFCAAVLLLRAGEILPESRLGRIYAVATAISALTALAIYQRGGFGPAHVLAIIALLALAIGVLLRRGARPGTWRHVAGAVALSLTILCHLIPGATELLLRVPMDAPYATSPRDPALRIVFLGLLVVFATGVTAQIIALRKGRRAAGI